MHALVREAEGLYSIHLEMSRSSARVSHSPGPGVDPGSILSSRLMGIPD